MALGRGDGGCSTLSFDSEFPASKKSTRYIISVMMCYWFRYDISLVAHVCGYSRVLWRAGKINYTRCRRRRHHRNRVKSSVK